MSFAFTEGQTLAIESRGEAVLVSAAAGSGKTRVLTERLMRRVTQEGCNIDSFLVITYTRAAAAELRERIISTLGERAAREPENRALRRQQNLCYRAQIGTIHSFCANILRENCQSLGLPPAFRVIDDERAAAMRERILDRVLDEKYETIGENPAFRMLADTVGAGRDDTRLAAVLLSLYEKLLAHPYPEDWAREQADAMALPGVTDATQCPWGRELMCETLREVRCWRRRMETALDDILSSDEKTAKAYSDSFSQTHEALCAFEDALDGPWDAARVRSEIPFSRLGVLRSPEDAELVSRVKAVRDGCKKAAQSWHSTFAEDSTALISGMRAMAPAMRELLETLLLFHREFSAEKRRGGWLDFSDLEHMTLALLRDRETGTPTPLAREISRRYTEIMVDEYQDVNEVQDLLFSAVSRDGTNLFTVGDVKQSIYRFRLADPTIFLRKYDEYSAGEGGGRLVLLRENFRSRRSVLDACNHVFSCIMSRELGDVDYDENAALHYGALGFPDGTDAPAVLTLLDPGEDSEENKTDLEAAHVARSIRKMLDSGAPVYENGVPRPCAMEDFAVLLLSPGVSGVQYRRALEGEGLSVQSESGEGFFETPEAADLLNLLRVIDNPHDDVTLIAVLRSPCFGFSPDELAEIRAAEKTGTFWSALVRRAEENGRCRDFCALLTRLRELAPDLTPEALLWRIYSETDMPAVYGAMPGGADRRANLMRMFEYAAAFTSSGGAGLYRFTLWLRRLAEKGAAAASGGSGVRIMSIHKSKGLEFPFVFLADLAHGFNKNDLRAPVLMHPALGLGPRLTDAQRGIEYPTLARTAIAARLEREMLSEQMRVLYVAMTRAKERLFMSCVQKNAREALDKLAPLADGGADYALLSGAQSFEPWLLAAVLADPEGKHIELRITSPGGESAPEEPCDESASAPSPETVGEVSRRLSFRYPFAWAQDLPTKVTATGLEGAQNAPDEGQELSPEPVQREFRSPKTGEPPRTAAARGTAMHAFLQHADLSHLGSREEVLRERDRLAALGRLTRDEAQALDIASLVRFGESSIPARLLRADELRREFRFTLLADAADYFDVPRGEELLMQGVVDCFIVENGEITVIDYKTDSVYGEDIALRARHYAPQVRAYAAALRRICGLPVREALLVFLKSGVCVSLRDF